jgi:hypothetical protein
MTISLHETCPYGSLQYFNISLEVIPIVLKSNVTHKSSSSSSKASSGSISGDGEGTDYSGGSVGN